MEIHISYSFLLKNDAAFVEKKSLQLPSVMQQKISAYADPLERQSRIVSKLLLQQALNTFETARADGLCNIAVTKTNKPVLTSGAYSVNATHSGTLCAIAVCKGSTIGIDAELIKPVDIPLMQDWLHANEIKHISESNDATQAFYNTWTKKEAVLKASGYGMTADLKSIDTTTSPINLNGQLFYCTAVSLHAQYAVHVATPAPVTEIKTEAVIFNA